MGYRQAFEIIHDENSYASGHQKRPRGPRPIVEPLTALNKVSLSNDLHSAAVAYYAHCHLEPRSEKPLMVAPPATALLSLWNANPALEFAVSAIALVLFANTKACSAAAKLAFESYQKGLVALRESLAAPEYVNIDACLLAVCLLGRYEGAVYVSPREAGVPFVDSIQAQRHLVGTMALLEYWVNCRSGTEAPTDAIKYARRTLRKAAIFGQIDFPQWLQRGNLFGEQGSMRELDGILCRLINARSKLTAFSKAQKASKPQCIDATSILRAMEREIRAIDQRLIEYGASYIEASCYKQHTLGANHVHFKQHSPLSYLYSHKSYAKAALRAQYYGYRILVNQVLRHILTLQDTPLSSTQHKLLIECQGTIDYLSRELASLTPFCLDMVKISNKSEMSVDQIGIISDEDRRPFVVELIATPLLIASTSLDLKQEFTSWFTSRLEDTGRFLGYGVMRAAASTSERLHSR